MFGKIFGKSKKRTFNYNEPDIGIKIIAEYGSNLIASCVIGMSKIGQTEELNEFCGHMAAAALKGDSFGVALSCFMIHKEPFDQYLPLSISSMSDESFEIFVELLRQNMFLGYSKSAKHYLVVNKKEVEEKANGKNPYAQWLMGAWYAFDDLDRIGQGACMKKRMYWYEKSAFEGYLPAIIAIAGLYDNGDDVKLLPVDLKKAAFWYRHGALNGDPMCAYNLGVMYTKGDFVQQNLNVASMWLSYAYDKSNDQLFKSRVQQFAAKYSIKLVTDFNINLDPELNNITSEFQDAYEEDVSILDLFKKVMDTPEFKKQKELFDLMSEMNSKDGCTTDEMPNGIGEFGLEPTNPIPTNTVHGSILYLGGLRTLDGKKVNNKRMGSLKAKNIQKPIDQYLITDESGEQLAVIYISPYQAVNSKKAPQGLKQVSPLL